MALTHVQHTDAFNVFLRLVAECKRVHARVSYGGSVRDNTGWLCVEHKGKKISRNFKAYNTDWPFASALLSVMIEIKLKKKPHATTAKIQSRDCPIEEDG